MNYQIAVTPTLRKSGWTSHAASKGDIWFRVENLKKQYRNLGFDPVCEYTFTCDDTDNMLTRDRRTYLVEQLTHAMMGAKGLHGGNKKIHGTGWTELFNVSKKQLAGYRGKAVAICKRLNWNIQKIKAWLKDYCLDKFGVGSWGEKLYGKKMDRTDPTKRDYVNNNYDVNEYKRTKGA